MTTTPDTLTWHRSDFGQYADAPGEALRFYVYREGRRYTLEVVRTRTVAGVTVPRAGFPVDVDRFHDTARLAKAVAAAYAAEPEGGTMNRITRAIQRGYETTNRNGR